MKILALFLSFISLLPCSLSYQLDTPKVSLLPSISSSSHSIFKEEDLLHYLTLPHGVHKDRNAIVTPLYAAKRKPIEVHNNTTNSISGIKIGQSRRSVSSFFSTIVNRTTSAIRRVGNGVKGSIVFTSGLIFNTPRRFCKYCGRFFRFNRKKSDDQVTAVSATAIVIPPSSAVLKGSKLAEAKVYIKDKLTLIEKAVHSNLGSLKVLPLYNTTFHVEFSNSSLFKSPFNATLWIPATDYDLKSEQNFTVVASPGILQSKSSKVPAKPAAPAVRSSKTETVPNVAKDTKVTKAPKVTNEATKPIASKVKSADKVKSGKKQKKGQKKNGAKI